MKAATSICVTYRSNDGWHVFESPELPGLCVASKDPQAAYNDVGPSIQALLKLDEGIDLQVQAEQPLGEFLAALRGESRDALHILASRRFSIARIVS